MNDYSVRKLFTGFVMATLIAWKLIVTMAMINAATPADIKMNGLMLIRYAKSCNHLLAAHHATGDTMTMAITISNTKSFDTSEATCKTDAPNTLRIPISLVRCFA